MKRLLLVIFLLLIIVGCEHKKIQPRLPATEKIENIPNYIIQGFNLTTTEEGVKKTELKAASAQVFEMKKLIFAQKLEMKNYEKDGGITVLSADHAVINTENNSFKASGNVRIKASNGTVIITDSIFWDDAQKKVIGEGPVSVIKDKNVISGIGFQSDIDMKDIRINKKVKLKAKDIIQDEE
ncbi:MAG: LPS export ABC transporter periplasmic protein LptC [Candidatus Goldbacteria bacterium]|nr:LPS export ABC transporter periplasmic protein LptC [Candidatus Goldiibacteriota bacterium]